MHRARILEVHGPFLLHTHKNTHSHTHAHTARAFGKSMVPSFDTHTHTNMHTQRAHHFGSPWSLLSIYIYTHRHTHAHRARIWEVHGPFLQHRSPRMELQAAQRRAEERERREKGGGGVPRFIQRGCMIRGDACCLFVKTRSAWTPTETARSTLASSAPWPPVAYALGARQWAPGSGKRTLQQPG
jgi:hypothetical protein